MVDGHSGNIFLLLLFCYYVSYLLAYAVCCTFFYLHLLSTCLAHGCVCVCVCVCESTGQICDNGYMVNRVECQWHLISSFVNEFRCVFCLCTLCVCAFSEFMFYDDMVHNICYCFIPLARCIPRSYNTSCMLIIVAHTQQMQTFLSQKIYVSITSIATESIALRIMKINERTKTSKATTKMSTF